MTNNQYAPTVWGAPKFVDLEVPSGQLCQVRPAGVQQLIHAGILESADTLTSIIDEKHIKRVQARPGTKKAPAKKTGPNTATLGDGSEVTVDSTSLMKDPEQLLKVFDLIDKTVVHMVVQPEIRRAVKKGEDGQEIPLSMAEREEGVVYSDTIDLGDKMFIFQYAVGGDADLASFRERFGASLASVQAS